MDDWGETDRPYVLGYRHDGKPERVKAQVNKSASEAMGVAVWSSGTESDIGPDDYAGGLIGRKNLPLPIGRSESVSSQTFLLDCRSSGGDWKLPEFSIHARKLHA
jgi:hypothetical protein